MGTGEGLPTTTKIRHMRSREIDIDPHTGIPSAPHVLTQSMRWVKLHFPSERGRETKMAAQRFIQPNEELLRLMSSMAFHQRGTIGGGAPGAPPRPPLPRAPRRPRLRPLSPPLTAVSSAASSGGGGMGYQVEALVAATGAPTCPLHLTMASGRRLQGEKKENVCMKKHYPYSLFIGEQGRGPALLPKGGRPAHPIRPSKTWGIRTDPLLQPVTPDFLPWHSHPYPPHPPHTLLEA